MSGLDQGIFASFQWKDIMIFLIILIECCFACVDSSHLKGKWKEQGWPSYRKEVIPIFLQKLLKGSKYTALSIFTRSGECEFTQWGEKGGGNLLKEMVHQCGANPTMHGDGTRKQQSQLTVHLLVVTREWRIFFRFNFVLFWFNQGYNPPRDTHIKWLSHLSMKGNPDHMTSLALRPLSLHHADGGRDGQFLLSGDAFLSFHN